MAPFLESASLKRRKRMSMSSDKKELLKYPKSETVIYVCRKKMSLYEYQK